MKKGAVIGLAIGGGLLFIGAIVTVILVLTLSGGGAWFEELASEVPDEAIALGGIADPASLLERVARETPEDQREVLADEAPFDVFDPEAWAEWGVDMSAPVGVAMLDIEAEAWLLTYGTTSPEDARKGLEKMAEEVGEDDELEEETFGDVEALVANEDRGPVFLFMGDRVRIVGGDRLQKYRNADDRAEGLKKLAKKVAKLEPGDSLATDEALVATMGELGDLDVAGWLAATRLLELAEDAFGDDDDLAFFLNLAKEARGLGGGFAWDDTSLETVLRAPMKDSSKVRAIFENVSRSSGPLSRLPAPAVAGHQMVLDLGAITDLLGDADGFEEWAAEELEWIVEAADEGADIDLKKDVLDNLSGEVGGIIDRFPAALDSSDMRVTFFIGVEDEELANNTLEAAYDAAKKQELPVEDEDVDGTTVYKSAEPINDVTPSAAVYDGYLWTTSHGEVMEAILEGPEESMMAHSRSAEVAGITSSDAQIVGWYDLAALFEQYGGLVDATLPGASPYTKRLDHISYSFGADGSDLVATLALHYRASDAAESGDDDDDDDGGGEKKGAFGTYMAKAKGTEAIDSLDKIAKGAALYYATPKVDMNGSLVSCQFPATAECTPEGTACDQPDDRFAADLESWSSPTWAALNFQMHDSHYFRYCFESSGSLAAATFTATAHADLDCDGEWSTFRRIGTGKPGASMAECDFDLGPLEQTNPEE